MITAPLKVALAVATLVSSQAEVKNQHLVEVAKSICYELVVTSSLPRSERVTRLGPVFDRHSDKIGQVKFLAGPRWIKASDNGRSMFREWVENHIRSVVLGSIAMWRVDGCRAQEAFPNNQVSLTLDLSMDSDRGDFIIPLQNMRQHFALVFVETEEGFRVRDVLWGTSISMLGTLKTEIQNMDTRGPLRALIPAGSPQKAWSYDEKFSR